MPHGKAILKRGVVLSGSRLLLLIVLVDAARFEHPCRDRFLRGHGWRLWRGRWRLWRGRWCRQRWGGGGRRSRRLLLCCQEPQPYAIRLLHTTRRLGRPSPIAEMTCECRRLRASTQHRDGAVLRAAVNCRLSRSVPPRALDGTGALVARCGPSDPNVQARPAVEHVSLVMGKVGLAVIDDLFENRWAGNRHATARSNAQKETWGECWRRRRRTRARICGLTTERRPELARLRPLRTRQHRPA